MPRVFPPIRRMRHFRQYSSLSTMAPAIGCWLAVALLTCALTGQSAETEPVARPGLKAVQLLTAVDQVVPGQTLTVALRLDPEPGYHTYWKGPGIVGVATRMEWTLPDGFVAGDILWPPPEKTLMAGLVAYGYRQEVWLLTDIEVPATLQEKEITLQVQCVWMACAVSCHPGVLDLSLTLPVLAEGETPRTDAARAARFEAIRSSLPPVIPSDWKASAVEVTANQLEMHLRIPREQRPDELEEIWFYAYDLQVNSDEPQNVSLVTDPVEEIRITLARPDFTPQAPAALSGLLYHPSGWPGSESRWLEVTIPWNHVENDQAE